MNVFRRMTRWFERRQVYELNQDDREILKMLGIDIGEVNVEGSKALKVATVYACIKILAETMSKLPLKIYKEEDGGAQKATKHYVYPLLKLRPNPLMSASDLKKCIEVQRDLHGNAYIAPEYEPNGRIKALWPIDSTKVKMMVDDIGLIDGRSTVWYEIDVGNGEKRKLMPDEILHFKSGVTLDGLVGISPIDYLKATVQNSASAEKFINNFFKQGLQVKGIVQYVGDLNEDAKKNFRENFEEMSSGLKNSHRIALMPVGYKFEPMGLSMVDAQFLENTELNIRQIASAFGIKMHQINELTRATHGNVEHQQLQFYVDTLLPILTMYEEELTYKLFLDSEISRGIYCKFNADVILRADIKTRFEAYRIAVQSGFKTPNEVRRLEEDPALPGGDILLVNGNMMPIEMAGQHYLKPSEGGE